MIPIYANQVVELTRASIKTRYRGAFAGLIWVILNPLMTFGVQSYAFHLVLKIDLERYYLFLLSGILPWIFICQCIEMGTSIFVQHAQLLKSYPIHPLTLLLSMIADNAINFSISLLLILIPISIYHDQLILHLAVFPICLFLLVFSVGMLTWLLASVNVFFRDTRYIASFILSIAFFMTPIFYPKGFVPEQFQFFIHYNPFYYMIEPFHVGMHSFTLPGFLRACQNSLVMSLLFFAAAAWLWREQRNAIYNHL